MQNLEGNPREFSSKIGETFKQWNASEDIRSTHSSELQKFDLRNEIFLSHSKKFVSFGINKIY